MSSKGTNARILEVARNHITNIGSTALHAKAWELFGKKPRELDRREQKEVILDCWAEKRSGKPAHFMVTEVCWPDVFGIIQMEDGTVSDVFRVQILSIRFREAKNASAS